MHVTSHILLSKVGRESLGFRVFGFEPYVHLLPLSILKGKYMYMYFLLVDTYFLIKRDIIPPGVSVISHYAHLCQKRHNL